MNDRQSLNNLKNVYRQRGIHSLISASFDLTKKCNLNCSHCYNQEKTDDLLVDKYSMKKIVNKLVDIGIIDLVLCGGEPLISEYFYDFIKETKHRGLMLTIMTNGLCLNENMINYLEYNLDTNDVLQVSTDFCLNFEDKQRFLSFEQKKKILENIELLCKGTLNVIANITPTIFNQRFIFDIVKDLSKIGIKTIGSTPYIPIGGIKSDTIKPDYTLLATIELEVMEFCKSKNIIYHGGISGVSCQSINCRDFESELYDHLSFSHRECDASTFSIHIASNGDLYPCAFFQNKDWLIGHINDSKDEILFSNENILHKKQATYPKKCKECKLLAVCQGGCPGLVYDRYKTINEVDPRCLF